MHPMIWQIRNLAAAACAGLALCASLPSAAATVASSATAGGTESTVTGSAAALRAKYAQLKPQLENNAFGAPVYLASQEGEKLLQGDVYGVVEHPFHEVAALADADNWCKVLTLPFNVKSCTSRGDALALFIGKKNYEPIDKAYRLDFRFVPVALDADYLERRLRADEGPLGTHNYLILLEAAPIDERHSFIHLSYAYEYGTVSKLAMQVYLNTLGAKKVGFSSSNEGGRPHLVGGMRGVMERNTMRYYLAIDAYLNSLVAPPGQQLERRLSDWFAMSARYRRQLWEMDRDEYMSMKRAEAQHMAQR
jgi:hypothetical protein